MLKRSLAPTVALALLMAVSLPTAAETIVFATAPTQSPEATVQQYQPIVNFLSRATGKRVEVATTRSFIEYASRMRKGEFDLIFDGPHFIGWRNQHLDHEVLAKLPGELRFVVVTRADASIDGVDDLIGRRVCGPAVPNLATLSVLEQFPNPARQPVHTPVGGFPAALACVREGRADAAVLRDQFWARQEQEGYKVVYQTAQALPDRGFSVTRRVDGATRAQLREALIAMSGDEVVAKALTAIGGASRQGFVAANDAEYAGLGRLLADVWGFQD
ncbi:phosphate/phosphite/phosphonate ABC transporter substrate-binding protein [Ectothiorhodospiraceae bacterium 2226]|nr:phosphate/phosphite/phosphonate ABC transporter substrate-binding protein [Ectothiorhodospiraceae bacterium 2226]